MSLYISKYEQELGIGMRNRTTQYGLLFMLLSGINCTQDPCVLLCEETANTINECLEDWPATWSDIGATSRQDFSDSCRNQWAAERSVLEPRALDDAYEQCEEATTYLFDNTQRCDQVRAIYLLPEDY